MINEKELKEAVEYWESYFNHNSKNYADLKILIDQCKLIVARDYIHKSKLLDKEEIENVLYSLYPQSYMDDGEFQLMSEKFPIIDGHKISDAIINRQVEKMGESND